MGVLRLLIESSLDVRRVADLETQIARATAEHVASENPYTSTPDSRTDLHPLPSQSPEHGWRHLSTASSAFFASYAPFLHDLGETYEESNPKNSCSDRTADLGTCRGRSVSATEHRLQLRWTARPRGSRTWRVRGLVLLWWRLVLLAHLQQRRDLQSDRALIKRGPVGRGPFLPDLSLRSCGERVSRQRGPSSNVRDVAYEAIANHPACRGRWISYRSQCRTR